MQTRHNNINNNHITKKYTKVKIEVQSGWRVLSQQLRQQLYLNLFFITSMLILMVNTIINGKYHHLW